MKMSRLAFAAALVAVAGAAASAFGQTAAPVGKWQLGRQYQALNPAVSTSVGPGKVEVVEIFWYGCGACYTLDPYLESWKKTAPAHGEFEFAFFTAEEERLAAAPAPPTASSSRFQRELYRATFV